MKISHLLVMGVASSLMLSGCATVKSVKLAQSTADQALALAQAGNAAAQKAQGTADAAGAAAAQAQATATGARNAAANAQATADGAAASAQAAGAEAAKSIDLFWKHHRRHHSDAVRHSHHRRHAK
ncbi:MAG: hypothetical protein RLZZ08_2067 [Pseudomonadota bacterium]|jgi:uncharacterized protein YceK